MNAPLLNAIRSAPASDREQVAAALAALGPEDADALEALAEPGDLRGDWRRAMVRTRVADLRKGVEG
jgi:hypothetical protein